MNRQLHATYLANSAAMHCSLPSLNQGKIIFSANFLYIEIKGKQLTVK